MDDSLGSSEGQVEYVKDVNYNIFNKKIRYQVPKPFTYEMEKGEDGIARMDFNSAGRDNPLNWTKKEQKEKGSLYFDTIEELVPCIQPSKRTPIQQILYDNNRFVIEKSIERMRDSLKNDKETINIISINPIPSHEEDQSQQEHPLFQQRTDVLITLTRDHFIQFLTDKLQQFEEIENYEVCAMINNFLENELKPAMDYAE